MRNIGLFSFIILLVSLNETALADEKKYTVKQCKDRFTKPSVDTLIEMAYSNCTKYLSDRSEPRRVQLRLLHPNCTDKRVGSTARIAEALYKAAKDNKSPEEIKALAEQLRKNASGRSDMYTHCWNTTKNSFDSTISGSISF